MCHEMQGGFRWIELRTFQASTEFQFQNDFLTMKQTENAFLLAPI